MWPSIALVLEKVHFYLPRIPKVTIQLFKDNHPHMVQNEDADDTPEDFKDFTVMIKSTYNQTAS